MKELKKILDEGLSNKWSLTESEKSSLWDAIEAQLDPAAPVAAPKRGGFIRWYYAAAALAAAAVALFFLLKAPSSPNTPFQPEIQPIEKTTIVAGNGADNIADTQKGEKDVQMPLLAHAGYKNPVSQQGLSGYSEPEPETETEIVTVTEPSTEEVPVKEAEPQKSSVKPSKEEVTRAQVERNSYLAENNKKSYGQRISINAASNFSSRGKLESPSLGFIQGLVPSYEMHSAAPQISKVSNTKYTLPLMFTLGVSYKLSDVVTVGSGVRYTYLHSKYNGFMNGIYYDIKQAIHYIGVPVNFNFNVVSSNSWNVYATAGGTVEKGVRVTYQARTSGQDKTYNSTVKGLQFSVGTGIGLEYNFSKSVGLYLQPQVVYYFDNKAPENIRSSQPLQVEAEVGLRFHIK
ncbi:MAG: outer membrane beta-barrel protein [Bacteroidales bacterium]|nr:outer membrane beta-barrel protein [Bacteroidales bacterium]